MTIRLQKDLPTFDKIQNERDGIGTINLEEEQKIHFLSDVIVAVRLPYKDEPLKDVFTADSDYCGVAQGAGS